MTQTASRSRIDLLSAHKKLPKEYEADRRSVYWIDKRPFKPNPEGYTRFELTPRQEYLTNPKKTHPLWKQDRATAKWAVPVSALSSNASEHLCILSLPKTVPYSYQGERSVHASISDAAMRGSASERTQQLAYPKPHKMWSTDTAKINREGTFTSTISKVSYTALSGRCTARVEALAEAKTAPADFAGARGARWAVSDTAMSSQGSTRLATMCRPKSRKLVKDDYNPYFVTSGAKKASASPRVAELGEPIARKCRQKKGAA